MTEGRVSTTHMVSQWIAGKKAYEFLASIPGAGISHMSLEEWAEQRWQYISEYITNSYAEGVGLHQAEDGESHVTIWLTHGPELGEEYRLYCWTRIPSSRRWQEEALALEFWREDRIRDKFNLKIWLELDQEERLRELLGPGDSIWLRSQDEDWSLRVDMPDV